MLLMKLSFPSGVDVLRSKFWDLIQKQYLKGLPISRLFSIKVVCTMVSY